MIANILGTIWVVLGLLWIIKPRMLKNRLVKKMNRKVRWVVYGFVLMLVFSLLGVVIKAQGLFLKLGGLVGIFIVVKGILLLKSKASEKISNLWAGKSLLFFRVWGIVVLASGILLILT